MSSSTFISLTFHLFIFSLNAYGLKYDFEHLGKISVTYGGRWKFLTYWSEVLNGVYFGSAVLNDILCLLFSSEKSTSLHGRNVLRKFNDLFFTCILWPLSLIVVIMFWAIYSIDKNMIFPPHVEALIPPMLNHFMHTLPLPALLIDRVIVHHHHPSTVCGTAVISLVGSIYIGWVYVIHERTGNWVYPFMSRLSEHNQLHYLFTGALAAAVTLHRFGQAVTTGLHGTAHDLDQADKVGRDTSKTKVASTSSPKDHKKAAKKSIKKYY